MLQVFNHGDIDSLAHSFVKCAWILAVFPSNHDVGMKSCNFQNSEWLNHLTVFQVVVRCEDINASGGLVRQRMKFERFLRKRMNTKPSHGPIHYRAPARIFWRTVRGYARSARTLGLWRFLNWALLCSECNTFSEQMGLLQNDGTKGENLEVAKKICT